MSALSDFLEARREWPWVPGVGEPPAPARELYDAYVVAMVELDRPVLSPNEFAKALAEAGWERERRSRLT